MEKIDLRSDTVTRPSPEMRRAIASAEVGDDVFRDDPTVLRLERIVAEMMGKEAALFVPSGTMGNQVALKTISQPGWELICERECHIVNYETSGPAEHSSLMINMLDSRYGALTADQIDNAIRDVDIHCPLTKIVALENTHNRHGGTIYPLDEIHKIRTVADQYGLLMHLDGARLWNAHVASGISLADWTKPFDTVSVCLSKGLGAPIGSLVLADKNIIERAIRVRKLFGGAMRQSGLIAAGGLYAIEHNIARLKEDHDNAHMLAMEINKVDGFEIDIERVQTNIVIANIAGLGKNSIEVMHILGEHHILCVPFGRTKIRFVTHLDVTAEQCRKAAEIIRKIEF
ncbi:MAG: GntG family PLP-dependent aldolase [Candidatus Zixiibacteriota bacterium]